MNISEYYTPEGQHPEDAIFSEKVYLDRLQKHIDTTFENLVERLNLTLVGRDWLFDYIFNQVHNETFEEYLNELGLNYAELVERANT